MDPLCALRAVLRIASAKHRAKQVSVIDWLFVILQEEEDDLESEEDCDEEKSASPTDWQKAGDLWVDSDGFVILCSVR